MTGGDGVNHWTAVDEASPDDDTSYVLENATLGPGVDYYNLGATALSTETVDSVDCWHRTRRTAAGGTNPTAFAGVRLSGSDTNGGSDSITSATYADFEEAALARPGGGSWAVSDLNSLQAKLSMTGGSTRAVQCTQVYVEVNYTAGGGSPTPRPLTALGVGT